MLEQVSTAGTALPRHAESPAVPARKQSLWLLLLCCRCSCIDQQQWLGRCSGGKLILLPQQCMFNRSAVTECSVTGVTRALRKHCTAACDVYAGMTCCADAVESLGSHEGLLSEVCMCGERQVQQPSCCAARRVLESTAGTCCH